MCLVGNKNWRQTILPFLFKVKPSIATEDITVYKILERYSLTSEKWYSPYRGVRYILGKSYRSDLEIYQRSSKLTFTVEEGLHAYTSLEKAMSMSSYRSHLEVFKAIIPKGSEYLIGEHNEIVSNHLVVVQKL